MTRDAGRGHLNEAAETLAGFLSPRDASPSEDLAQFLREHSELVPAIRGACRELDLALEEELQRQDSDEASDLVRHLKRRALRASRYEVQGEVKSGGMGAILRVWDEDLRRTLAMKVVLERDSRDSDDPRMLLRFVEEARVTGQLEHPGIIPVHEFGVDEEGRLFFTMRLVAGRNLEEIFQLVADGTEDWSETRAVGVLLKVCETMAYAHSKGVVHRDLKPANVMVGRFGEVYVVDWGLARLADRTEKRKVGSDTNPLDVLSDLAEMDVLKSRAGSVTLDGDIVGTPAFMSPEQASGQLGAAGPLADVYSAGAILYHLLTGTMPYVVPGEQATAFDVWKRAREGPPRPVAELRPGAPAELVAICEKAMARAVEDRYPSMQELADDLRSYLEGRVVRAYEAGALAEFRKWVARNRSLAWTILTAILVVTLGSSTAAFVFANKNKELGIANETALANERLAKENEGLARTAAAEATRNAVIARERADEILRLSDVTRIAQLRRDSELLWPPTPGHVGELEVWLADAREALQRLPTHAATLQVLRARALDRDPWRFANAEDQWQHDTLSTLIDDLRDLANEETGLLANVQRRLDFASTVEELTRSGDAARRAWQETRDSVADVRECPLYEGLVLEPQLGLVPLGRDPRSGLHEFAVPQSGEVPERDVEGDLILTEASAIVLVLIPGGEFWMGAQSESEDEVNFSETATEKESPPHRVKLEPYFIAKHEVTQGQWLRHTGSNPSTYDTDVYFGDVQHDLTHPVEQVSWFDAERFAAQHGLELPTEARWEYACRAGEEAPWWSGWDREDLEGGANLADGSVLRAGVEWPTAQDWPELDDGYPLHAPIGSFRANRFGLHDMAGNVWEWCLDGFGTYDSPVSGPAAEREPTNPEFKLNRGGSYYHTAHHARSSHRNNSVPETLQNHLGFRVARSIE